MNANDTSSPTEAPRAETAAPVTAKSAEKPKRPLNPWALITLLVLALASWQWYALRTQVIGLEMQIAKRNSDAETASAENRGAERQLREQADALQGRLTTLEARLSEDAGQREIVQNLIRDLANGRDDGVLQQVEQILLLAQLQQRIRPVPEASLFALQTASDLLAKAEQTRLAPLRQAVQRDLDKLKAVKLPDQPAIAHQLAQALANVDTLPLAYLAHPVENTAMAASTATPETASLPIWRQMLGDLWHELRGLIRIQRFDETAPGLMAPEQAYFLRENLRLRLLHARLALANGDNAAFQHDLTQADRWLSVYFDATQAVVKAQREQLKTLLTQHIAPALPGFEESLTALRALRPSGKR